MSTTLRLPLLAAGLIALTSGLSSANNIGATGSFSWNAGPHQANLGGEFSLTNIVGLDTSSYSPLASNQLGIGVQTFCLEVTEYAGSSHFVVSNAATAGSSLTTMDPISNGTAYLYSQFAQGILNVPGGDYFGASDRLAQAALLQEALWALEDETIPSPNSGVPLASNPYYQYVVNNVADYDDNYAGTDVVVLVNFDTAAQRDAFIASGSLDGRNQDFLFYTGGGQRVPDGGTTVALLGLALLGLFSGKHLQRR